MTASGRPGTKGTCSICGQQKLIRKDGRIARHLSARDWDTSHCKGSGKRPAAGGAR